MYLLGHYLSFKLFFKSTRLISDSYVLCFTYLKFIRLVKKLTKL